MNLCDIKAASTSGVWKTADVAPDQFPAGLRVLVVDDDPTGLRILEKMLLACFYKVTKCNRAETALSLLRQDRNGFDVVISDVHMPDMDGFKLLEHIGLEMDLPVIMMSADDGKDVVLKGVTHGACDYLIKPVRIEALKNIWQHVVRKRKNEWKDIEQSGSVEDGDRQVKPCEDADNASSANEGSWRNSKKRKDEEDELEERDDTSTLKKPRVVWSVELHQQFVAAVHQLGIDKAVPKKILAMMNVPGLTRENVASHLQKYCLYLRRLSGVSQHQNGFSNSFMTSPQEATFGQMSSLNGIDFQTLAASGQLQAQSLATLQASALGNQRNIFSFENPKLRFEQQQQQTNNSSKPVNLLHGIPTTMELKQLSNFHSSAQSFGGMNMQQGSPLMMQIAHAQSRRAPPNEATSSPLSTLGQPKVSNGLVENGKRPGIITVSEEGILSFTSGVVLPSSSSSSCSSVKSHHNGGGGDSDLEASVVREANSSVILSNFHRWFTFTKRRRSNKKQSSKIILALTSLLSAILGFILFSTLITVLAARPCKTFLISISFQPNPLIPNPNSIDFDLIFRHSLPIQYQNHHPEPQDHDGFSTASSLSSSSDSVPRFMIRGPALQVFPEFPQFSTEDKQRDLLRLLHGDDDVVGNDDSAFGLFDSLRDRTKDLLSVVVVLLFGVGCGALTAGTMYFVYAVFRGSAWSRYGDYESDSDDEEEDIFNPKKGGYVMVPSKAEESTPVKQVDIVVEASVNKD